MERINGRIAMAYTKPEGDGYEKKGVRGISDKMLLRDGVCVVSRYKGCTKCECYRYCEYGKEAVRRGLRK